jgi:hypothetical protein
MTSNQPPRGIKLLPRDISESLGKLPPQAIEMEESVLGAVLLEVSALSQVPYLKPEHFYTETHKVIYEAIIDLFKHSEPVDMRTVVNQLRKTGKLEIIGGGYKIAELTSKVSSAANIDYHARIIVEMSMKRSLIEIASKVHHDAYEDTTDVFKLFEDTLTDIQFLHERETKLTGPERIKALWADTLITIQPDEPPPLIYIDGVPVMVPGNHTLLVGKKKSRKTLLIVHLIAEYLKKHPKDANSILLFDTEQGKSHVFKIREKIHQITGLFVPIFYLRGMSPAERRDFIRDTVQYWPDRLKITVIDGIRDLMSNINDPDETTDVLVWLEKLTLQHNLAILEVLHLNKTDNNARGHIGSELLNKAYMTIEVELDEKSGQSVAKCESSRDKPFEMFSFWHDKNGLPEIIGLPAQGGLLPVAEKNDRMHAVFQDGPVRYKDIIDPIKANFECGINRAKQYLAEWVRRGYVVKSGKDRSPDCTYKLVSSIPEEHQNGHQKLTKITSQTAIFNPSDPTPETTPNDLPF